MRARPVLIVAGAFTDVDMFLVRATDGLVQEIVVAEARYADLFERTLRTRSLPFEIAEIRTASDPLTATAKGSLIAALYEK